MVGVRDKSKNGGRPRKAQAERRESYIGFWVTAEERAAIHARAAQAGETAISAFARAAALSAAIRVVRHSDHSPELVAQLRRIGNNLNQCLVEARSGHFRPSLAHAAEDAIKEISAVLRAQFHGP